MEDWNVLLRGILAGLIISASVGPVNLLCISRALTKGRKAGLISGLGAASADTIYGAIAGFSIQFVIGFLIREMFWLRLFGGMVLIGMGVHYWLKSPQRLQKFEGEEASHSDFVSASLLNLTNPTTVLSFLAVLTALRLDQHRSLFQSSLLVAGIFSGAMSWWITLALTASRFRDRMNDRTMVWMNRIAGIAIGGFGLVTMALSRLA